MSQRQRVSEAQIRRQREQLSERDQAVLVGVRDFRLMSSTQIQRLHFSNHSTHDTAKRVCRRVLKRLHSLNLLRRLERRIGGIRAGSASEVYALTPLGHRMLQTEGRKRWREPSAGFVNHTLAIAELASLTIQLVSRSKNDALSVAPEPHSWRTFHDGLIESVLKPDLALTVADRDAERSWFVEVDLDTESRTVIERKCQLYSNYWRAGIEQERFGVFPKVLWVAPDERRAAAIASTFSRTGIEPRLFDVITADRAPTLLAGTSHQEVTTKGDSL